MWKREGSIVVYVVGDLRVESSPHAIIQETRLGGENFGVHKDKRGMDRLVVWGRRSINDVTS